MAATIDLAKHFALFLILLSVLCQICNGYGADHKNVLFSLDEFYKGESLNNGNYSLKFQTDCRLGLYDAGKRIWASSNPGFDRRCDCELDQHGKLVINSQSAGRLWVSDLEKHKDGGYALILQNDRNLVIHGPDIWCVPNCYYNGRNVPNMIADSFQNKMITDAEKMITDADVRCEANKGIVLYTSQSLDAGECLKYGRFTLKMQHDCNLVLYNGDKVSWATNTTGKSQNCYLYMPYDGNLAVRGYNLRVLWSAFPKYKDDGSYVLVLLPNGKITILGSSIWATGTNIAK